MCRARPEVNRSEVFRGRGPLDSATTATSRSLATPAVQLCWALKRRLNAASRLTDSGVRSKHAAERPIVIKHWLPIICPSLFFWEQIRFLRFFASVQMFKGLFEREREKERKRESLCVPIPQTCCQLLFRISRFAEIGGRLFNVWFRYS